jgi:hypothetical protein
MEEFILRIGANANALKSELGRAGAFAKAWATTLVEDMHSKIGRMFAAGFMLDKGMEFAKRTLENIQEKILAVKRAQNELPGTNANFIQGMFNFLEKIGLSYEMVSKPLLKFKQTLDVAKAAPGGQEMQQLIHYGIATSAADLRTQKFTVSVAKLSEAYLKYGKNLQVVKDLVGKESLNPALLALLELGPEKLNSMNKFNFFSDISQNAVNTGVGIVGAKKTLGQVLTATSANLLEQFATHFLAATLFRGNGQAEQGLEGAKKILELKGKAENATAEEIAQIGENLQQEQARVDIQTKFLELKEKERELTAEIADQGKSSVQEMAATARKITGLKEPIHTLSPRMMNALKIDTLEKRAKIAFEQGRDQLHDQLMNQAQELRSADTGLMDKDRNPMKRTETELQIVNQQLKPVAEMAEQVNKNSK